MLKIEEEKKKCIQSNNGENIKESQVPRDYRYLEWTEGTRDSKTCTKHKTLDKYR